MFFEVKDIATLQKAIHDFCEYLEQREVPPACVFDSKLVAHELVGNVLRHSNGIASLHGEIANGFVQLKIASTIPFEPPKMSRCSDVFEENGRGLFLVDKVCAERTYTEDGAIRVLIKIKK
jgi:anti-sigma regulatory factor (Ser/Thr protein kinase)